MTPMSLVKTADGKWNLTTKVVALMFTAVSAIFAAGQLVGTLKENIRTTGVIQQDVKAVEGRVQTLERGQVRHEVLDSVMVNELREMRSDVKQLLRRR